MKTPNELRLPPPESLGPLRVDTLTFGQFGAISLYRRSEHPSHVVLFVSGDGGWNLGVVRMAEIVAGMDAAVAGIDIRRYENALDRPSETCGYPAADFEALSQWLQKRLGYPSYTTPILAGYSSGATLVYAILVEAPHGTFAGALSLGFCPALPLRRPLCRGNGLAWVAGPKGKGVSFLPADSTGAPWVVLQGESDSTCYASRAAAYVRRIRGARIVELPKVGHGFAVESRWVPEFRDAFVRITRACRQCRCRARRRCVTCRSSSFAGVATIRRSRSSCRVMVDGQASTARSARPSSPAASPSSASMRCATSGRRGIRNEWAPISRGSRATIWKAGASENCSGGLLARGGNAPLHGKSFPPDLKSDVRIVALLGAARSTTFEFHLRDWLGRGEAGARQATAPEIQKLRGLPILCIYGTDEKDSVCPLLPDSLATSMPVQGGHHFGGEYRDLALANPTRRLSRLTLRRCGKDECRDATSGLTCQPMTSRMRGDVNQPAIERGTK